MRKPIIVPDLGCGNVVLKVWYVKPGEAVFPGDRLVELLLGNATFDLTADCWGRLAIQSAAADERVAPGQIVGHLEPGEPD